MKIYIASFDIGKKNFAFYIEECDREHLLSLQNVHVNDRYNPDGTPTKKMQQLLEQICSNGRTVLHKNLDLTKNCDKSMRLDPETFHNMNDVLDEYKSYWDKCCAFVIEQQMQFAGKGKLNPMAQKLGQHCYSYFTILYKRTKQIVEFSAQHKTRVLGAPKTNGGLYKNGNVKWINMTKPQRKKWAVKKAVEILKKRGEEDVITGIKTVAKKDDLADTLVQLQAFKYLIFVEKNCNI